MTFTMITFIQNLNETEHSEPGSDNYYITHIFTPLFTSKIKLKLKLKNINNNTKEENIMIYMNNAATTKPDAHILEAYSKLSEDMFYNSESLHGGGLDINDLLQQTRNYIQKY